MKTNDADVCDDVDGGRHGPHIRFVLLLSCSDVVLFNDVVLASFNLSGITRVN